MKITIVGAGLAGLTAAINLAGSGHSVRVLEADEVIGCGTREYRPDPAGSPFDIKAVENYTGIDISPAVRPIDNATFYAWGKPIVLPLKPEWGFYMVERGSRESSLDTLLYRKAIELGVKVEFGSPVRSREEFEHLPPGTIIATGLHIRAFDSLGIPHSPGYSHCAKGTANHRETNVSLWMDTFSKDYAFNSTINGISIAMLFQRGTPPTRNQAEKYKRLLFDHEGARFNDWHDIQDGACPVCTIKNPRLFHGDKILCGSLSGMMDPILYFGMLGALVSGAIAARAVEDRRAASAEFKKAVRFFYPGYLLKKIIDITPDYMKSAAVNYARPGLSRRADRVFELWPGIIPGNAVLNRNLENRA